VIEERTQGARYNIEVYGIKNNFNDNVFDTFFLKEPCKTIVWYGTKHLCPYGYFLWVYLHTNPPLMILKLGSIVRVAISRHKHQPHTKMFRWRDADAAKECRPHIADIFFRCCIPLTKITLICDGTIVIGLSASENS
jgi:hypothetical protein